MPATNYRRQGTRDQKTFTAGASSVQVETALEPPIFLNLCLGVSWHQLALKMALFRANDVSMTLCWNLTGDSAEISL